MKKTNYNLAVYCGARSGNDPLFTTRAQELGTLCAQNNIGVVYGGGRTGLMGTVAGATLDAGGTLEIVDTMHQRKIAMIDKADAFVAMPGGPGTLEEFFEVFSWQFLDIHSKPVALLNVNGYWDKLIDAMHYMASTGLLNERYLDELIIVTTPEELLEALAKDLARRAAEKNAVEKNTAEKNAAE